MPKIKPFYALKATAALLDRVVTRPLEQYSLGEARLIASENPISFLHLVSPELNLPYLRSTLRKELFYKTIGDNLKKFIENKVLAKATEPAIYVYQVKHDGIVQTGIWTLTHINDYLQGNVKKHELTVEAREELLAEYLQQTGLDANPVLITYLPDHEVSDVIKIYTALKPTIDLAYVDGTKHKVWAIDNPLDQQRLIDAFAAIPTVYVADGHHRLASMARMCMQKRAGNGDENAIFNYFTTVYMDTEQLKILPYNRLIRDLYGLTEAEFIKQVAEYFDVKKTARFVKPDTLHHFAMYLKSGWYTLVAKAVIYDSDPVNALDVHILQQYVLAPILGIKDARTDARLTFEGEKTAIGLLEKQVTNGINAVVFILNPIAVDQVINVANAGKVMPPKSTWVEPKFLVGLLTNYFSK